MTLPSPKLTVKECFEAGFKCAWPGHYFNSTELLSPFLQVAHPRLMPLAGKEMRQIREQYGSAMTDIMTAHEIGKKAKIVSLPPPGYPSSYFAWAKIFGKHFGESQENLPEAWHMFHFGLHAGEILAGMKVIALIVKLSEAVLGVPAFEKQWAASAKNLLTAAKHLSHAAKQLQVGGGLYAPLHDSLYVKLFQAAHEIGGAEMVFLNTSYMESFRTKAEAYVEFFHESIERTAENM